MKHSIVITGGHTGLGLAATRHILATTPDAHIVWASRSLEAAQQTAAGLSAAGRVSVMPLDLAALDKVRHFAADLQARLADGTLPPLGTLVCNAGIQFTEGEHWTAEGIEQTFGVNHLAHFLLVETLRPQLEPAARVVVVSSGTHLDTPSMNSLFGVPPAEYLGAAALAAGAVAAGLDPLSAKGNRFRYGTSKLCNLLFVYELDRRLRAAGSQVTVNAFDPGLMPGTGLARAARRSLGLEPRDAAAARLPRHQFARHLGGQPGLGDDRPGPGGRHG